MRFLKAKSLLLVLVTVLFWSCSQDDVIIPGEAELDIITTEEAELADQDPPPYPDEQSTARLPSQYHTAGSYAGWKHPGWKNTGQSTLTWSNGIHYNPPGGGVVKYNIWVSSPGFYKFAMDAYAPPVSNRERDKYNDVFVSSPNADMYAVNRFNTSNRSNRGNNWIKVFKSDRKRSYDTKAEWRPHSITDVYFYFPNVGNYQIRFSGREPRFKLYGFWLGKRNI